MLNYLDFEKPVADIEGRIQQLKSLETDEEANNIEAELSRLEAKAESTLVDLYEKLAPWQKVQVARHPARPHFSDYVSALFEEFVPMAGDRLYAEDEAIQAGLARFRGRPVALMGHEKGNDTKSRVKHNFGSARPEGYRKAVRLMNLAERFGLPVISLVDTAGAYPGVGAEERGQAEAIARSTDRCLSLRVPNVSVILGEGGSGGAIAIATTNRVIMLEHSIYSVISPEGAASILWRDATKSVEAATNMQITAQDLMGLGIIDSIVKEPAGGAHRYPENVVKEVGQEIERALDALSALSGDDLVRNRQEKFLAMGRTLS